jgi:hypothetical protein
MSPARAAGLKETMRNLIITENITLDGVIDATEGWFSPAGDADAGQSDVIAAIAAQREAADAVLAGYPVVLGRGRRLFADATGVPRLKLVQTQPFRSGTALLRYRVDG